VQLLLPDVALPATDGTHVNLSKLQRRAVVFCYPYTGRPDVADPPGWDDIKGAHGSTPQALAFSNLYDAFEKLGVNVFGLSFQNTVWQSEFVGRNHLRFPLLSDEARLFSRAMGLKTFFAGAHDYLVRRTFVVEQGFVVHDLDEISKPENNAGDVLKVLQS
jgi:peroxiredoxin